MTTTETIRRSPRITRPVAAILATAALFTAAYQATPSTVADDDSPPVATMSVLEVSTDPLQLTPDLTPVVAAHQVAHDATNDPLDAMVDLTPVVSAHIEAALISADPLDVMRDFRNPREYASSHLPD